MKIPQDEQKVRHAKSQFSQGLKLFKTRKDYSITEIAEFCGVTPSIVSGWINLRTLPTFLALSALFEKGMTIKECFQTTNNSYNHTKSDQEEKMSNFTIIKHGKFWKQFTCPKCGCIFNDSDTSFTDELSLLRGFGTKAHVDVHCPECYTRCIPDEEDKGSE